jgi:chromosome segregation and condensation protein ScpB
LRLLANGGRDEHLSIDEIAVFAESNSLSDDALAHLLGCQRCQEVASATISETEGE